MRISFTLKITLALKIISAFNLFNFFNFFRSNVELRRYIEDNPDIKCDTNVTDTDSFNICEICDKSSDEEGEWIQCDKCKDWYHLSCIDISEVPRGEWFCPKCYEIKQSTKSK